MPAVEKSRSQVFTILMYNSIWSTIKVTIAYKQLKTIALQQKLENKFQYYFCKNAEYYGGVRLLVPYTLLKLNL